MKSKIDKYLKYVAATVFVATLAINIAITLDDPFVLLSDEAIATTTSDSTSTDDWTCNAPIDEPCTITVTASMDLGLLGKWLGYTPEVGASVDISDMTQLYSKGGTFRCGEDKTCYDLVQELTS